MAHATREQARRWWRRVEKHLVDDWRRWHKWASIRWAALLLGLLELQDYLPRIKEYLPDGWVKYFAFAIIIARLLKPRMAAQGTPGTPIPPSNEKG